MGEGEGRAIILWRTQCTAHTCTCIHVYRVSKVPYTAHINTHTVSTHGKTYTEQHKISSSQTEVGGQRAGAVVPSTVARGMEREWLWGERDCRSQISQVKKLGDLHP